MRRRRMGWFLTVALASWAEGAALHGSLRYAGRPVAAALPAFAYSKAVVARAGESWRSVEIDPLASSWRARDLAPGTYAVQLALARTPVGFPAPTAGQLFAWLSAVSVAEGEDKAVDFDLAFCVHVTSPYDNARQWPGNTRHCPYGAAAPAVFSLAWEPVPLARRYRVVASRWSCNGWLADTAVETTATAVTLSQRTDPAEAFLILTVLAFDEEGRVLSMMPHTQYEGSSSTALYVHAAANSREAPERWEWCVPPRAWGAEQLGLVRRRGAARRGGKERSRKP